MNRAHAWFWALMGTGLLLLGLLSAAAARLLFFTVDDTMSAGGLIVHWCLAVFTGSASVLELLFLGSLGLLPLLCTVAAVSLVRQRFATGRLLTSLPPAPWSRLAPDQAGIIARLGLTARVDLADNVAPFAFCHGFLRPRIYLSTGLLAILTNSELEAVLIHERHHLRCYDPLRVALAQAVGQALFFLPIASDLRHGFMSAKELAADAAAIQTQRSTYPLASALYRLITQVPLNAAPAAATVGVADDLDRRIAYLLDPHTEPQLDLSVRVVVASAWIPLLAVFVVAHPGLFDFAAHAHALTEGTITTCAA